MKKQHKLKLRLDRETLAPLTADAIANVQGGTSITITTVTVTTTLITHPVATCK